MLQKYESKLSHKLAKSIGILKDINVKLEAENVSTTKVSKYKNHEHLHADNERESCMDEETGDASRNNFGSLDEVENGD